MAIKIKNKKQYSNLLFYKTGFYLNKQYIEKVKNKNGLFFIRTVIKDTDANNKILCNECNKCLINDKSYISIYYLKYHPFKYLFVRKNINRNWHINCFYCISCGNSYLQKNDDLLVINFEDNNTIGTGLKTFIKYYLSSLSYLNLCQNADCIDENEGKDKRNICRIYNANQYKQYKNEDGYNNNKNLVFNNLTKRNIAKLINLVRRLACK